VAAAFLVLGGLLAILYSPSWSGIRGGLTWLGWYTAALQVVLSGFLLVFIDDLRPGGRSGLRWTGNERSPIQRVVAEPVGLARGLLDFYRVPFLPAFGLSLGIGLTASAIAQGGVDQRGGPQFAGVRFSEPELVLTAIWLCGAVLMVSFGRLRGYLGFVSGFAAAIVFGDLRFAPDSGVAATIWAWSASTVVVAAIGAAIFYVRFRLRLRRIRQ
jgi:hypothetical protein